MNVLLTKSQVSAEMVARVAHKLADFHHRAETSTDISAFGNLNTITQNTEENFTQTEKYIGNTIPGDIYRRIKDYTDSFIRDNAPLFHQRVAGARITSIVFWLSMWGPERHYSID